jgi:hypothetical protein
MTMTTMNVDVHEALMEPELEGCCEDNRVEIEEELVAFLVEGYWKIQNSLKRVLQLLESFLSLELFEQFPEDFFKEGLKESLLNTSATFPQCSMTQTPPEMVEIDLE